LRSFRYGSLGSCWDELLFVTKCNAAGTRHWITSPTYSGASWQDEYTGSQQLQHRVAPSPATELQCAQRSICVSRPVAAQTCCAVCKLKLEQNHASGLASWLVCAIRLLKLAMLAAVALHRAALARVVALPSQLRGHRTPVGEEFVALRVGFWVDQHTAGVPSPNGSRLNRRVHPQRQPQLARFNP
jgi:hypothetical protein